MRRRLSGEHGAALVEFTLILPVLLLVIVGVSSLLWLTSARSKLTDLARDAARYASIPHDPFCDEPPCGTGYPTESEVRARVLEEAGVADDPDLVVELVRSGGGLDVARNESFTVTVSRPLPDAFRPLSGVFGLRELVYSSTVIGRAE